MDEVQNKVAAKLKGVGDGFRVTVDPTLPVERLQEELAVIFKPLNHLAHGAGVVIDTGVDEGHEGLIQQLGFFLKEEFKVGYVSSRPQKPSARKARMRQRDLENCWNSNRSDVLVMAGRVRAGQKITAERHLVLMGDVNPGAEIFSGGDILVLGSLRGTAVAGQPDHDEAIIFALDFRPTQIQIGGYVAAGVNTAAKYKAEYAHVENGGIVVDDYLDANPFNKLPWPEKR